MRPVPDDIRNYIVTHYNIVTIEAMKGVYTSNLQAGRSTRFQAGVNNRERNGAQNEAARIRKAAASRSETIRKERWRIAHGFPQLTKLRLKIATK